MFNVWQNLRKHLGDLLFDPFEPRGVSGHKIGGVRVLGAKILLQSVFVLGTVDDAHTTLHILGARQNGKIRLKLDDLPSQFAEQSYFLQYAFGKSWVRDTPPFLFEVVTRCLHSLCLLIFLF